ncbi:MAG: sulfite exporter TauE/SafE family protein [Terriglobales bacterium]
MALDFLLMFTLGLVSSLHCAQMCGPIVLSYSVALNRAAPAGTGRFSPLVFNHLAYNAGRTLTYSILGAAAGLLGSSVGLLGRLTGLGSMLALITGSLMVLIGLVMFGLLPGSRLLANRALQFTSRILKPFGRFMESPGSGNRFLLGLGFGLLPCGVLYAALLKSAATGSMLQGALSMLAFGAGTASSLLTIGLFCSTLRGRFPRWNAPLVAAGITAMGLLLLWRGTMAGMLLTGHALHGH